MRILVDMGAACMNFEDRKLRGLYCAEIEADEIWAFVHCKAKTLPSAKAPVEGAGDCWTWYAVDRKSKAIQDAPLAESTPGALARGGGLGSFVERAGRPTDDEPPIFSR